MHSKGRRLLRPPAVQAAPLLVVLAVLLCPLLCRASEGDESGLFHQCMQSCLSTGCTKTPGNSNTCDTICQHSDPIRSVSYHPPWALRLMRWDCEADCSYHCMWALETPKAAAGAAGGAVYKYYGKWPFVRVLGAQEIASVLFSIANLLAHVHNLRLYLRCVRSSSTKQQQQPSSGGTNGGGGSGGGARVRGGPAGSSSSVQQYPYHSLWVAYSLVNINAWVWSSVFHCRDTRLTERFDYFSADLVVAVGLGVVIARVLQLTTTRQRAFLALALGAALLQHVHYMAFVKFDYGYNMTLCIALGIATAAAWLVWATSTRHPGRWTLYRFMGLVHLAMLLEVLDFPPFLSLFDAHALWHAATVPLTYVWYQFMAADVAAWHHQQQQQVQVHQHHVDGVDGSSSSNRPAAKLGTLGVFGGGWDDTNHKQKQ